MKVTVRVDAERHVRDEAACGAGAEPDHRGGDRCGDAVEFDTPAEVSAELDRDD